MKNYLFCLFFLTALLRSNAQAVYPNPLPPDSSRWVLSYTASNIGPCPPGTVCYYAMDVMTGDTVIGGVTYKKVGETDNLFFHYNAGSSYFTGSPTLHYKGALRQDIPNKKIFLNLPNSLKDTLMYDFNLQVGDTVPWSVSNHKTSSNPTNWVIVQKIDSSRWGHVFYKRFTVTLSGMYPQTGSFQQGIGNAGGLFNSMFSLPEGGGWAIWCFDQYSFNPGTPQDYQCSAAIVTGLQEHSTLLQGVRVSLHSTESDRVYISSEKDLDGMMCEVYNSAGQQVKSVCLQGTYFLIDLNGASKGLYFLRIHSEKEQATYKVVLR
jgi:hypothetical protein